MDWTRVPRRNVEPFKPYRHFTRSRENNQRRTELDHRKALSRKRSPWGRAKRAGARDVVTRTLPNLLTSNETAGVLRTSKKAIYAMVARGQIPGVIRIGRRVLFQQDVLVEWLRRKSKPSLER